MTSYNAMDLCQGVCDSGGNAGMYATAIFLSQNKTFSCKAGKAHRENHYTLSTLIHSLTVRIGLDSVLFQFLRFT